jgi:hypothetical protein
MYQESLCILHRRYLSQEKLNPAYDYSRKTCGDAALQLLKHHADIEVAFQGNSGRWCPLGLQRYAFLLAAMITSLDLYESCTPDLEARVHKYEALRHSYALWVSMRSTSQEANRASNVLATMLSKIPYPGSASTETAQSSPWIAMRTKEAPDVDRSSTVSSGLQASSATAYLENPQEIDALSTINDLDPLNILFSEYGNVDWVS